MARNQRTKKVVITTVYTDDTIPEIGMVNGVITLDDDSGLLSQGWESSISQGLTLNTIGKFTDIKGGSFTVNLHDLQDILRSNNIPLAGSLMQIVETLNGVDTTIYSGEITGIPNQQEDKALVYYESAQRNRPAKVTSQIPNSDEYYPVLYGNGRQKLVNVESDVYEPLDANGNFPVWRTNNVRQYDIIGILGFSFLTKDVTDEEWLEYVTDLETKISEGWWLVFESKGIELVVESIAYVLTGPRSMDMTMKDGNIDLSTDGTGGIGALQYGQLTMRKSVNYGDPDSSTSNALYEFEDNRFKSLPSMRDGFVYSGETVSSVSDEGGYKRLEPLTIDYVTESNRPSFITYSGLGVYNNFGWWHLGGSVSAINADLDKTTVIDGDINTSYSSKISFFGAPADDISLIMGATFGPVKDKPSQLLFTGKIDRGDYTVGALDNYKVLVWVDFNYGNSETGPEMPATTDPSEELIDNHFPLLKNAYTGKYPTVAEQKEFRWQGSPDNDYFNGFSLDLIPVIDAVSGGNDWDLALGFTVYWSIYTSSNTDNIQEMEQNVYDISLIVPEDYSPTEIYSESTGRESTIKDAYIDSIKRQNLKANNIAQPLEGWGLAIPTVDNEGGAIDWTTIYNDTSLDALFGDPIYYQYGEVTTQKIKADILRHCVCVGYTDNSGIERVVSPADVMYNTDGVIVEIADNYKGSLPVLKRRQPSDIFPLINVSYGYNVGTGKNTKTISITNAQKYTATSVTGDDLTSTEKREIWDLANTLYRGWGSSAQLPQKQSELFFFTQKADALEFIKRTYSLQGAISVTYGSNTVAEAYDVIPVTHKLYTPFVSQNSLQIGSKLRTRRVDNSLLTGMVTNISEKGDMTTLTALMIGKGLTGATNILYRETGSAAIEIPETGSQAINIIEGVA
ncbi:MAG: hypothetical protein GY799_12320 [Desulfobulbaceae bacterium]|nr:hypothetical protein [Desulfobulbaceae bacterium]